VSRRSLEAASRAALRASMTAAWVLERAAGKALSEAENGVRAQSIAMSAALKKKRMWAATW